MKPLKSVIIILIGNELLNGSTKDKNAAFLLEKLAFINDLYVETATIPDIEHVVIKKIQSSIEIFDLIITSGGLGPTTDDLTIQSIAKALDQELVQDSDSLLRLEEKFKKRGRELKENNLKQTFFPSSALILPNNYGTADASISKSKNDCFIASFPGVPKEFQPLIENEFFTWLNSSFEIKNNKSIKHFRIFGLSESYIGTVIESLKLDSNISIAYRPQFPEILISLKSDLLTLNELENVKNKIISAIGEEFIISHNEEEKLPIITLNLLKQVKKTISLAESCTGGRISSEITKIPGASSVFLGSIVCYSNKLKTDFLKIETSLLETKGAVSPEVATLLAENIRALTGSDYSVAVTGISGPDGGSSDGSKPVGLVYISLNTSEKTEVFKYNLPLDRERNQLYASWLALDLIRRSILNLNLTWEIK
jgi:nicotinamide-nucleotide amidase